MISERQASSKTNTSFNPVTGDSLTSKVVSQEAYASGWERIFGNKQPEKIPLEPLYVYSVNEDGNFNTDCEDEIIQECMDNGYDVYFRGQKQEINLNHLIDAGDIIESISDRAWDLVGEIADDFPNVSKEAKQELQNFLDKWLTDNCTPHFYQVTKVEMVILNREDVVEQHFLQEQLPNNVIGDEL